MLTKRQWESLQKKIILAAGHIALWSHNLSDDVAQNDQRIDAIDLKFQLGIPKSCLKVMSRSDLFDFKSEIRHYLLIIHGEIERNPLNSDQMNQVEYKNYEDKIKSEKATKGHEAIASRQSLCDKSGPPLKKAKTERTGSNGTTKQGLPEKVTFSSTSTPISTIQKLLTDHLSLVLNETPKSIQPISPSSTASIDLNTLGNAPPPTVYCSTCASRNVATKQTCWHCSNSL